ncbi:Lumazine-binding domain [Serratia ficaria]|uniref:DUF4878 domain-containing protein n=1 Tax=Serratia ficaria TaxID=61651 RepID=UPI00217AC5B1|nr:DUF4878 domain-containing protein [Serratia ficaria]CAI1206662.1 Lumazine-binding domain [Serratia ficaria]CAI2009621.1 Lumazine-binding domain [Serratia ficaria]CAI2534698.1 Lumazine-binding domain [Serratia ficaria]
MKKVIGVTLLLIGGILLSGCGDKKPGDVAKDFYVAMEKKDVDKAYKMLYLNDEDVNKELEVKGKLQMIVGEVSRKIEDQGGTKNIEISKVKMGETTANVVLHVKFKNGTEKDESFNLRQKKDEWKVLLR